MDPNKDEITVKKTSRIFTSSISELHESVSSGEFTEDEIVDAHFEKSKEAHKLVNSIIAFFDKPKSISKGRLHGIPFTIKAGFEVKGMPFDSGHLARKGKLGKENAIVVKRLLDEGAVPIGMTNVPPGLTWIETDNLIHGRTRHPLSKKHTPAGSSGGEGAHIALGGSVFGIGSDFGGSLRLPASFCGISTHKPSPGLIPDEGQWPPTPSSIRDYNVIGPLARSAKDLRLLCEIMSSKTISEIKPDPSKHKVLVVDQIGPFKPSKPVQAMLTEAANVLKQSGFNVRQYTDERFLNGFQYWFGLLAKATEAGPEHSVRQLMKSDNGIPFHPMKEIAKLLVGRPTATLPLIGLATLETISPIVGNQFKKFETEANRFRESMIETCGENSVIICPTFPFTAPRHHMMKLLIPGASYCALFNVFGQPSTVVPRGFSNSGFPLGIQIAGVPGADALTLGFGEMLERQIAPLIP